MMQFYPTLQATIYLAWGIVAHLIADWFLQNHWQATTKTDLRRLGGWFHALCHLAAQLLVFPWPWAAGLAMAHLLIDTRKPVEWWGWLWKQSTPEQAGPDYIPFAMGRDQAAHVICIAIAAYCAGW